MDDATVDAAEDCGALLDGVTALADELAEGGAEVGLDAGAELREDEAAVLAAEEAELAEAPVPTGAFWRR